MATRPVETVAGVVTSWVPVTAQFSAPAACSGAIYSQQGGAGQLIAFDPFFQSIVPSFTDNCFPPQATAWYNQGTDPLSTVLSMGPFECPGGYSTAFTSKTSTSTQIACCPSGYAFQGSLDDHGTVGECWSTPNAGSVFHYFTVGDSGPWSETSTILGATHVVGVQLNGWNFATATSSPSSTSAPSTSSASSASSSSSSASSGSSSSSTSPSGSSSDSSPDSSTTGSPSPGASSTSSSPSATNNPVIDAGVSNSSGLSTGSKAALGVGIALAVIGLAALAAAFLLYRRNRQMNNAPAPSVAPDGGRNYWGGRAYPKEMDTGARRAELVSQQGQYYEMGHYQS